MTNFKLKAKFLVFISLLAGLIFILKGILAPPFYQSSFSVVLLPQNIDSRNASKIQDQSAFFSSLIKQTVPGSIFLEKINTELKSSNSQRPIDVTASQWARSISVHQNPKSQILTITAFHKDPKQAVFFAALTSQTLKNNIALFTNSNNLEAKLIDQPLKASTPGILYFAGIFFKGILLGALISFLLILTFKEKTLGWLFIKKKYKIKPERKKITKKQPEPIISPNLSSRSITPLSISKTKKNLQTSSDQEIKERLNRLISGDL
ncbi:MAG: hypothetical protein ABIC19_03565 [Patescibacteria group bacterium]|nr:hypothetical protein [Patescibacteria group bacterium]